MNLDTLRRKRIKRLGVKAQMHTGQRRVFFILDRATRRFHGDISLWMQYIEYARQQRAHKKLSQILTNALRLHPTHVQLWIYAARYALEDHADMTEARGYMQQGLRFCKSSRVLWVQYAKLEMIYISRIAARQKVLGLDGSREVAREQATAEDNDLDADELKLPELTGEDVNPSADTEDGKQAALQTLNNTPALTGAIPIAVFDAAMSQFADDPELGYDFYNMVCEFEDAPCFKRVLEHIVDSIITRFPENSRARICHVKYPVAGIKPTNPQFPRAFAESLSRLKAYSSPMLPDLAEEVVKWLQPLAATDDLDPALHKVMLSTLGSAETTSGQQNGQL